MHDELGSLPEPLAARFDPTAVHRNEASHYCETDAESTRHVLGGALAPDLEVEDPRQQVR
jgi:hypothetical protein